MSQEDHNLLDSSHHVTRIMKRSLLDSHFQKRHISPKNVTVYGKTQPKSFFSDVNVYVFY
jgi:hypothetical protein